jgi:hypothetical protein
MVVVDILLFCNLVLFAVCAARSPKSRAASIDDLVREAAPRPPVQLMHGSNVVPFPGADELARRRARVLHPSHPSSGLSHHPSFSRHPSLG